MEYLFKAKDIETNKWLEGSLAHYLDDDSYFIQYQDEYGDDIGSMVHKETVCQYTGLKDFNFKEDKAKKIFSGDILQHKWNFGAEKGTSYLLVKFDDGAFRLFEDENQPYSIEVLDRETIECCNLKVVGNIFDNPKLMKLNKRN